MLADNKIFHFGILSETIPGKLLIICVLSIWKVSKNAGNGQMGKIRIHTLSRREPSRIRHGL
jgi:hypothetical protein